VPPDAVASNVTVRGEVPEAGFALIEVANAGGGGGSSCANAAGITEERPLLVIAAGITHAIDSNSAPMITPSVGSILFLIFFVVMSVSSSPFRF
jgi:hypothetical protein